MSNLRIVWNMGALRQLRMDAMPIVDEQLQRITADANSMSKAGGFDYETHESDGAGRARGTVFPTTPRAMVVNMRDNVLIRALGSGGQ